MFSSRLSARLIKLINTRATISHINYDFQFFLPQRILMRTITMNRKHDPINITESYNIMNFS